MARDAAALIAQQAIDDRREADVLRYGREVVAAEAQALAELGRAHRSAVFVGAVEVILAARGSVIVTGIGKAGLIGQKLAATFASTGARAHFLHPAEAFHGDLGRVHADDVVLALSQSGETAEVLQLLPALRSFGVKLIAMTASAGSTLGRASAIVLSLGPLDGSVLAGPGAQHQHHRHAGPGRCARIGRQPVTRLLARGFRPVPSGRGPGPKAQRGRRPHATARTMPRWRRRTKPYARSS